jgi:uncharacterized membrane protein (UPF0182 family)
MSDFFADDAEPTEPVPPRERRDSRRPRPLVLTLIVLAVLLIAFSLFANVWTDKLWFRSIGYSDVFSKLLWTKVGLFAVFGLLMGLIVGGNLFVAYRIRPVFRANSTEQANLERYREVITPIRKVLLVAASLVFAIFAGASATGKWRIFMLWENRQSFGEKDVYFHKDLGFYIFTLPWLHWLVSFTITALVIGLIAAVFVHYIYGGIRLQARSGKVSGPAQAQISIMLGLLVLLKGLDYYLGRFDLTSAGGGLVTGMTYSREHAVLPSKNILIAIAVICAGLFFANVVRRTWLLPGVGLALFGLSAVLIGMIWPAIVQSFQVKPDEPDKESTYIGHNIDATRKAYGITDTDTTQYDATTKLSTTQLSADARSLPGIRLLDPTIMSTAFDQLQQPRKYYGVSKVLDVDRYEVNGQERDMVVGARELDLTGLPDAQKKWANEHTVYTHGFGIIAAYGNQQDANGKPVSAALGSDPVWAEQKLPPEGVLSSMTSKGYEPRIYFGENSPNYSIVGKAKGGKNVELDYPEGTGDSGSSHTTTYEGKGGVPVGSLFNKLLYAVKFGDPNMVLSSRVGPDSKVLYDRSPRERVQKVAPWLTVDSDALPAVVDGRIVWILDGYTTTDKYPLSEKRSLQDMTSDAINPRSAYATQPTDDINYMRNAVKATVDAYDGTVTLYEWDTKDPLLKAWEGAFPGVVKSRSSIPTDLLAHFRYPEDLFKVQRDILAAYHVTDPKAFYEGNDKWEVPEDPESTTNKQPPYRLSVATQAGQAPVFSLTSVYVPSKKQNLASFISVGADAADPTTYGKFHILRLSDTTQIPGPSNVANNFGSADNVQSKLLAFKNNGTEVKRGNLLTLPFSGGLLYVQPIYTLRSGGAGNYPQLRYVVASLGDAVGIGTTLDEAIDGVLGKADDGSTTDNPPSDGGSTGAGSGNADVDRYLGLARDEFQAATAALKKGDLTGYSEHVKKAQGYVDDALAVEASGKATSKTPTTSPTTTPSTKPSGTPSSTPSGTPSGTSSGASSGRATR